MRLLEAAEREREYSPSSCIGGNYAPYISAYKSQSAAALDACQQAGHTICRNLAYGPAPSNQLDLFLPKKSVRPPPMLLFIHGGYWQELSKDDSLFAAFDCVSQGFAFAAIDYTLAPKASVQQIIQECQSALKWLNQNAAELGFDSQQIIVAGSSAGAHLASLCATAIGVKALVLVSGIFDLEPLIGTSVNTALQLTSTSACEASPQRHDFSQYPSTIVCWGEVETNEFKRQSREFAEKITLVANKTESIVQFEIPERNHFDVIMNLAKRGTLLGDLVIKLLQR